MVKQVMFNKNIIKSILLLAGWALGLTLQPIASAQTSAPANASSSGDGSGNRNASGNGQVRPYLPPTTLPRPAYIPAQPGRMNAAYTLGPGDILSVTVLRHPEFSANEVTVTTAGQIYLPVVGAVPVAGKTIERVRAEVAKGLLVKLRRPEVTVILRQARPQPQQVFILGSVRQPGVYDLGPGYRITEALALAGGLAVAQDKMDLIEATLTRPNQTPVPLDIVGILRNSNQPANQILQPGDTLRIAERSSTIAVGVAGLVQKPGRYDIPIGGTIVDALAQAGGAAPKAALTKATIKRANGTVIPVDLFRVMTQGEQDVKLEAGDVVVVPESNVRVTIQGAVLKPGYIEIEDGKTLRLSEAVALGGGTSPRAALSRASVRHANGKITPANLYKLLVLGQQDGNLEMASGDVVLIPELKGITVLGAVGKPGTYYIEEGAQPRVSDVLAQVGGLSVKPELAHISIARRATSGQSQARTSSVDTVSLLELKDLSQNELVQDGDLITVSTAKAQMVFVSGEVKTPGAYELKEGDSVPELIARAGGTTPMASLKKVNVVERDGTTQTIDVYSAINNGQKLNLPLQEGDYVIVPRNEQRVLVMQGVNQPGYYAVPENGTLTLGDALLAAGGPKDRAKLKEVAVLRQTPNGVDRRIIALDRTYEGQLAINATLQSGDIVYVPEGRGGSTLERLSPLLSLGSLLTLFR